MNSRKRINTSSKYKGVSWSFDRKIWQCHIWINGKSKNMGRYLSEIDAARVYNLAAKKYYGQFARLNELPKT